MTTANYDRELLLLVTQTYRTFFSQANHDGRLCESFVREMHSRRKLAFSSRRSMVIKYKLLLFYCKQRWRLCAHCAIGGDTVQMTVNTTESANDIVPATMEPKRTKQKICHNIYYRQPGAFICSFFCMYILLNWPLAGGATEKRNYYPPSECLSISHAHAHTRIHSLRYVYTFIRKHTHF